MKLERVDYTMMRGLELVMSSPEHPMWCNREPFAKPPVPCDCGREPTYSARWHSWRDFLYIFIDQRYVKYFYLAMGWWSVFYVRVYYPEISGVYLYLLPIGIPIIILRAMRKWWFLPFKHLEHAGYSNRSPGARPALFWPVHLRFRRNGRLKE